MKKELKPGWYFVHWDDKDIQNTMAESGPYQTQVEAAAEREKMKRDGLMCGLPIRLGFPPKPDEELQGVGAGQEDKPVSGEPAKREGGE